MLFSRLLPDKSFNRRELPHNKLFLICLLLFLLYVTARRIVDCRQSTLQPDHELNATSTSSVFYGPDKQIGDRNFPASSSLLFKVKPHSCLIWLVISTNSYGPATKGINNRTNISCLVTDATPLCERHHKWHEFQRRLHWRVVTPARTGTACRRRETTHCAGHRWLDRTSAACQSIHPFIQSINRPSICTQYHFCGVCRWLMYYWYY